MITNSAGRKYVCYSEKCTHCGGNLFCRRVFCQCRYFKSECCFGGVCALYCLDAGHGGVDPGVLGVTTTTKEGDINLAIVKKLAGYFSDAGFRVILMRKNEGGLYGLPTAVKKPVRKALYVVLGCIGLVLGAIGAILPMLPSFPFLMLTAFCFGRSSDRQKHKTVQKQS